MKKESKSMLVLTLPLKLEPWQYDRLNKKMENARQIYNSMLAKWKAVYAEMTARKDWKETSNIIKTEKEKMNAKGAKKNTPELTKAYQTRNSIMKEYGFTEYSMRADAIRRAAHFAASIPSNMASQSIGIRMWTAFRTVLFAEGENVSFRRWYDFNSLSTDNASGMRFVKQNEKFFLIFSNRNARAKELKIPVACPDDDVYAFRILSCPVKQVRLVRRREKSRWHFYVQLTADISSCVHQFSEPKHTVGFGKVGIAIWRGELYAVSEGCVKHFLLNPWKDATEKKIAELDQHIDILRRQNNPNNYNSDGTPKSGAKKWNSSVLQRELGRQRREILRIEKQRRIYLQRNIVYELLEMGDEFVMLDYLFKNSRNKYEMTVDKTAQEYIAEKEHRKSVQQDAPAELIGKLSQKLAMYMRPDIERYKVPHELYWYQHIEDRCDRNLFPGKVCNIDGVVMSQTVYRAFLMLAYDAETKSFDKEYLDAIWSGFLENLRMME